MALSTDRGNYKQFSVIARPRQGTVCSLSTYGMILEIQEHLSCCKCICNVAFSPPNYIIHLPRADLQLQILGLKSFRGKDYILDILPWCFEYTSFDLPWIITSFNENGQQLVQQKSPGISKDNAEFLRLSKRIRDPIFSASIDSIQQGAEKRSKIGSSSLARFASNTSRGLLHKGTVVKIATLDKSDTSEILIDFSYLMIVELKKFYHEKFSAFQRCNNAWQEIYATAQRFSDEVEKAIKSMYNRSSGGTTPPQDILDRLTTSTDDLNTSLWFISEEMFSLEISMRSICGTMVGPIDLVDFSETQFPNQVVDPIIARPCLRAIAEATVTEIYDRNLLIATDEDLTGGFSTQVWCSCFHHTYKSGLGATEEQTEANAIYRFLKHLSNVLGYTVQDFNCDTLYTMVSQINYLNGTISDLQLCTDKAVSMVRDVSKTVAEMVTSAPAYISEGEIRHGNADLKKLVTLLQAFDTNMQKYYQKFEQYKRAFRSVKLQSPYRPASD